MLHLVAMLPIQNVYRQLSVVQCRYLSRMLTAAVGSPHRVRLDQGRTAALPGGFALGERVPPRALIPSGFVLVLLVR
jgi:hypothetical protein